MTLHGYLKVFLAPLANQFALCAIAAAAMWIVNTRQTDVTQKVGSYTATVTLVVGADGSADDTEAPTPSSLARIALYVTTGEIPHLAAESLG